MKRAFLLLTACLLALSAGQVRGSEPSRFKVSKVEFRGVESVSKKELAKTLALRPPPFWKVWAKKPVVAPSELEEDVLRIKQFYQTRGFYNAQVDYETEAVRGPAEKGGLPSAVVVFQVKEGAPVRIDQISLEVAPSSADLSAAGLRGVIPLKKGEIFKIPEYEKAKERLLKHLKNRGYPLAELKGKVVVNAARNVASVSFDLNPGKECAFGPVSISGNDGYVKDVVIRRALDFERGETYSENKVEKSQRNLFDLDVFRLALIKPEEPVSSPSGECELPMVVQLKPKKRQSVKLGLGYGSEDGFRVKGTWVYRNLFGWGGNLSLSGQRSNLIWGFNETYLQPYFLGKRNTLGVNSGVEEEDFVSYTNRKIFADGLFNRRLTPHWTGSFGYNLELDRLVELKLTDPVQVAEFNSNRNYLISSVKLGATRDTANDVFYPTEGGVFFAGIEQASSLLGSELSFFQPTVELKTYHLLFDKVVLAGRVRIETIQATEDTDQIPIFKRFFLGGANTVRGYGFQMLGPLDENEKPLGGLSSFLANLEMRFPIYQKLSGVVFVDMGLLDTSSFSYPLGDMQYTSGVGARYETPIGPIRIDFGYKLNPPTRGDLGLTTNPDEPVEGRWRIDFSVGQAF